MNKFCRYIWLCKVEEVVLIWKGWPLWPCWQCFEDFNAVFDKDRCPKYNALHQCMLLWLQWILRYILLIVYSRVFHYPSVCHVQGLDTSCLLFTSFFYIILHYFEFIWLKGTIIRPIMKGLGDPTRSPRGALACMGKIPRKLPNARNFITYIPPYIGWMKSKREMQQNNPHILREKHRNEHCMQYDTKPSSSSANPLDHVSAHLCLHFLGLVNL